MFYQHCTNWLFPFLPAGETETAFQAAHLEKLGWRLCLERALHLHHPAWDPWQQPPHKACSHPLGAAPFLVSTWWRKVVRRNPAEVEHAKTRGGEDSMRAGSCGRMVGCAGERGHIPSPFRRTQRVTVMSFFGSTWKSSDENLYIKAKYYYCHFYSHSICLCLEHSTASALIFNKQEQKRKIHLRDCQPMVSYLVWNYDGWKEMLFSWHQSQFDSIWWLLTCFVAVADGICSLVPGQAVEEKALFPSIKLLVREVISFKI